MKRLKFRVWFVDEMIYSNDYASGEFDFSFNLDGELIFSAWNDELHKLTPDGDVTYEGWDYYTNEIMQFTGIYDMNGKEIYEGDILKNSNLGIHIVEYSGCQWIARLIQRNSTQWPAQYLHCEYMGWTVIGNIYENPKLFKEGEYI